MPKKPKPGGSVFEPRSRLHPARSFGKAGSRLAPVGERDAQFDAAQFQHLIANAIRERISIEFGTLPAFIKKIKREPSITYDRISRILRGETMMTLTDLLVLCKQFPQVQLLAEQLISDGVRYPTDSGLPAQEIAEGHTPASG